MMMSMPDTGDAVDLALLRGAPKGGRSPTAGVPRSNAAPVWRRMPEAATGLNNDRSTRPANQLGHVKHPE